jgi:hypothetical protein
VAAGLVAEANVLYGSTLLSGKKPVAGSGKGCGTGLRAARTARHKALLALRDGELQERLDHDDAARLKYIEALTYDASLAAAAKGRARVGSRSVHGDVAVAIGKAARDGSRWTQDAVKWVTDRSDAVAVAAVALGIVLLLLLGVFHRVISLRKLRGLRRTLTWSPLRRFTQTTAEVMPIEGEPGVTATMSHMLVLSAAAGGVGPDVQPPSEDVLGSALDDLLTAATPLAGVATVFKALRVLLPSRRFTVRGEVIPIGPNGVGLVVHIADWRGRRTASKTFWSADWAPASAEKDDLRFYTATAAGCWLRARLDR